ncbi:MAG: cation diffusion facilitator family transporter [Thermoleophilia bacterium]
MAGGHNHGHGALGHQPTAGASRGLLAGIGLNLVIVVVEIVAGLAAASLALLSDAVHNFTDIAALGLAWFAIVQARKPPSAAKTFGHHRTGVLTALINSMAMVLITIWIFYEAARRFAEPEPVGGALVMVTAAIALAANLSIVWVLRSGASRDINIRSAVLHLLGDAAASAAVLVSGLVILLTGWDYADAVVSILLGLAILVGAWQIIKEALEIFLEESPRAIDVDLLVKDLMQEDGVRDIHDIHVWTIGSELYALSCHVLVDDVRVSESARIIMDLKRKLAEDFGITHSTLEVETVPCATQGPYCELDHRPGGQHEGHHH